MAACQRPCGACHSPEPSLPLVRGIRIVGRFEIVRAARRRQHGRGLSGARSKLGRDVALKLLSPALATSEEHLLRFEREARAASALNHPHICTVYDVGQAPEADGRPYLVMELLRGQTLFEMMAAGPMPLATVVAAGRADRRRARRRPRAGIIHRDLKPANIFVTARGDAEAARLRPGGDDRVAGRLCRRTQPAPLTSLGTAVGTVLYMSPEQALGDPLDRADRYLLVRRRALRDADRPPRVRRPLDDGDRRRHPALGAGGARRPTATQIPPAMRRLLQRMMAKHARQRAGERRGSRRAPPRGAERIDRRPRIRGRGSGADGPRRSLDDRLRRLRRAHRRPLASGRRRRRAARRRRRRRTSRTAIVLGLILLLVAVAAYSGYSWYRGAPPPLASREPLLLADFTNTTGEAVFDGALKDALEIQLRQSPYPRTSSRRRRSGRRCS